MSDAEADVRARHAAFVADALAVEQARAGYVVADHPCAWCDGPVMRKIGQRSGRYCGVRCATAAKEARRAGREVQMNVRVTREMHEQLRKRATSEGTTVADVIRRALELELG